MPTRRFNYTDCRRIPRSCFLITLDRTTDPPRVSATIDLSTLELPSTADVVLEAYVDWTVMRFRYGTVDVIEADTEHELTEFDSTEGVRFRVKVLGTDTLAGLILAEADAIRPSEISEPESGHSFVLVRPSDLGSVVWRLTLDENLPILHINERIGDWKSFLSFAGVRALLLPEVLRQLLREAAKRGSDADAEADWPRYCELLASGLGFGSLPSGEDDEETERWVDEVVRKFAQKHRLWSGIEDLLHAGDL